MYVQLPHSPVSVTKLLGGGAQIEKWSSLIGIITAIVGNILISLALNIQRYAHLRLHKEYEEKKGTNTSNYGNFDTSADERTTQNGKGKGNNKRNGSNGGGSRTLSSGSESTIRPSRGADDDNEEESYLKSPYWWAGIGLMTVGEAGNFIAYGFAPSSIVAPLGVVALISNCVIAPIVLKESFRWRDFGGVVVAIAGAVTVVLSANQEEKRLGPHEIIEYITRTEFEIYMAITIILMGFLAWASPRYGSKTILIDLGLVGLFGGYTALATKGISSMFTFTLYRAFTFPITYALLVILASTAILQVKYVNKALQRFSSTQVIPVQFVLFTLSVILGSAILFRDFESSTTGSLLKFIGGCVLTFFGVFLITGGRAKDDSDDSYSDDAAEEVEERISPHQQEHHESGLQIMRTRTSFTDGNESQNSDSRRSSRVSFLDPSPYLKPHTSHATTATPGWPTLQLLSSPTIDENTPLITSSWKPRTDEQSAPARAQPGLAHTKSNPAVPTEAQLIHENAPVPYVESHPLSRTVSHTESSVRPLLEPPQANLLAVQRPVTPRHSLSSRILPGPYLSPLSSSLSAVVAETRRRKSSQRRPKPRLRGSKSGTGHRQDSLEDYGEASYSLSPQKSGVSTLSRWLGRTDTASSAMSDAQHRRQQRARSLSNTLGDFSKGTGSRPEDDQEERQDEYFGGQHEHQAGPSSVS